MHEPNYDTEGFYPLTTSDFVSQTGATFPPILTYPEILTAVTHGTLLEIDGGLEAWLYNDAVAIVLDDISSLLEPTNDDNTQEG